MSSFRRAYAGPGSEAKSGVRSGQITGLLDEVDQGPAVIRSWATARGVIASQSHTMEEAVAIMSGAPRPTEGMGTPHRERAGKSMIQDWA